MNLGAFVQRRRVAISWVFALFYLALASPRPWSLAAGAVFLAAGCLVRAWAAGHIRKQEELAVSGPYAYTRNPLYFGSSLVALGALVMAWNGWVALVFAAAAVPLYLTVMKREERFLEEKFGYSFRAYRAAVPLFFPRLGAAAAGSFDVALLRRNKEWRVWAGAAAVTVLLGVKYYWLR